MPTVSSNDQCFRAMQSYLNQPVAATRDSEKLFELLNVAHKASVIMPPSDLGIRHRLGQIPPLFVAALRGN